MDVWTIFWPPYDRGFSGNPYDAGEDRTYSMDTHLGISLLRTGISELQHLQ